PIPPPAEACARRGLALAGRNRIAEAETAYRQGLAIAPDAARLHFNLAKLLLRAGRQGPGRESLAAATRLGLAQDDRELLLEVARLLVEMNFPDEAQALLRQAGVD
ncbi:MAG: tetratricopeptide repeat protein, partial [Desulfarculus sp.]|nr:tetratricopeptide repeat protein [Desulfarculus sp.]